MTRLTTTASTGCLMKTSVNERISITPGSQILVGCGVTARSSRRHHHEPVYVTSVLADSGLSQFDGASHSTEGAGTLGSVGADRDRDQGRLAQLERARRGDLLA